MINDFEKLMEEFLFLTPRKNEPEFLLTKPREVVRKNLEKMEKID